MELPVGERGILDEAVCHVHAKPVHAALKPESQNVVELRAHFGVVPVEVGLGGVEHVEVPLPVAHPRPRRAAEYGGPIGRRLGAVGTAALAEPVAVALGRSGAGCQCCLEPLVFGG